ncbi:MAG: YggS family pyridoxal phosphate-dependent enzyme [Sphingobacteriaceae bacterium]|nr:YggS family pyridoxal phosphate-dependent enzyme [Sphingobacteriaceae bacterium]
MSSSIKENIKNIKESIPAHVQLIAVSKTKSVTEILEAYDAGQRDFGENYVQEFLQKQAELPKDIRWHFIGHLQTNKVKQILPHVHLIHGVDSLKLLKEIHKESQKINKISSCLIQIHIAEEESKFGFDEEACVSLLQSTEVDKYSGAQIKGFMGMASFTDDERKVRSEFQKINKIAKAFPKYQILSYGMSGDYKIAIEEGSNMIRVGSLIFGSRIYNK